MIRTRRRRQKYKRIGIRIAVVSIAAVCVCALLVWKVFTVKKVLVSGNEVYSDSQIEKWVLNDRYSWNSLYVLLKYKFSKTEEHPFVDSFEVTLKSPHTIEVTVNEKAILGYIYIPSLGGNAYFDKDGFVVGLSKRKIDGAVKIYGLSVKNVTLYKKLDLKDTGVLKTLLAVTQILKKYDLQPEAILVQDSGVLLSYGKIQVNVGDETYLNEKIARMQKIFPKIKGMTGTLRLEAWTETNTNIYFEKKELTKIPDDVQTVPTTKKASE